jgi:hypothetical protein
MKPKTLIALKLASELTLSASGCRALHETKQAAIEALKDEPISPPQPVPLVPLGENVTRDGRKVRVICNDRVCPGNVYPVTAMVLLNANEEIPKVFHADGKLSAESEGPLDLVGHLPPEPAKPREFWLITPDDGDVAVYGVPQTCAGTLEPHPNQVHFREVLPGADDELEDLRRWKAESMQVFAGLDLQAIGYEIGLPIGTDIGPQILPYIRALKKFIGNLRQPAVSARVAADADKLLER